MGTQTKTVLVSGASGLVGVALCKRLKESGYIVKTLSRSQGDYIWDVPAEKIDPDAVNGADYVVHLAGETIAQRWNAASKRRILNSRVASTKLLVKEILKSPKPPTYISASGSSFYGYDCGPGADESARPGNGFLSKVCQEWEGAAKPLLSKKVRCVFVRTGIVLSPEGGALAKMLPPFKAGLGGRIGSGDQLMSWIALPDLVDIYLKAIEDRQIKGPVNAVAPKAITNRRFTKTLGEAINRPALFPVPEFMVKILFGEMGKETVLADQGLVPMKLQDLDFEWTFPDIKKALEACVGD